MHAWRDWFARLLPLRRVGQRARRSRLSAPATRPPRRSAGWRTSSARASSGSRDSGDEPPALAVWPDLDLDGCAAGIARLAERWPRYLAIVRDEDLERRRRLPQHARESTGPARSADILTHVTVHGAYHRGADRRGGPRERRRAGIHRLHPRGAPGAGAVNPTSPGDDPHRDRRRAHPRGAADLVRQPVLVRPAARRHPDRARDRAGLCADRLDAGGVAGREPGAVPGAALF